MWYSSGFLAVVAVVVDTIPDLLLRPYLSGEYTHVGLLMLAYVFGTVVWGFYGLFLAPIVLVLSLTFVYVVLPFLAGEDVPPSLRRPEVETTLDEHFEVVEEEELTDADEGLFWIP
jgi:predicted PurR-regulated permease PerM